MKSVFKVILTVLALSSMVFVSCKKEDNRGNGDDTKKVCYFNATVQMTADFIAACESITFEYKDAEGVKVNEVVDASKLKATKIENPSSGAEIDGYEWTCKFDYKNSPAEVYFKPTVQVKENLTFDKKVDLVFYPKIVSGIHPSMFKTNYDSAFNKYGVDAGHVASLLTTMVSGINKIEVDTTIGE